MKLNSRHNNQQNPRLEQEIRWLLKEKYRNVLSDQANQDINRLEQGEHVDYLIGFVNFLDCKIDLSFRPLIPRPETECWVKHAIQQIQSQSKQPLRCLDMFAGSGCVGVAILKHLPRVHVDFADNDKRCLAQIRLNTSLNTISNKRYRIIQSDLFSTIKGKYDYILANPPYLATTRKQNVQSSVLENEPDHALFAGPTGLNIIKKFLAQARQHLAKQGRVYLEFDSFQKTEINKLLTKYAYSDWQFHKDQFGQWRYLMAKRKSP